jgi:hypothetical protein
MSTGTQTHTNGAKLTFNRVTAILTLIALFASAWTGYALNRSDANKLAQEMAAKAALEHRNELDAAEAIGAKKALEAIDREKTKTAIDLVERQVIPSLNTLNTSMGTMSAIVSKHSESLKRIEDIVKVQWDGANAPANPVPKGDK